MTRPLYTKNFENMYHVHSRIGFFNFTGKLQEKTIYSKYITE